MTDKLMIILIASVVAAVLIGIGVFNLLGFMRGTIKLNPPVTGFGLVLRTRLMAVVTVQAAPTKCPR